MALELPRETISLTPSVGSGMMAPVIVKAAWGMVVAEHSGLPDVTFAEASTGRNAVSPAVADADGCCVTALPLRFVAPGSGTISELLDLIREQQVRSIQHEAVGMKRIIDECASWSRFTSLINHQRSAKSSFDLGGAAYTASFVPRPAGFWMTSEISITATQGPASLEIGLSYAVDHVPRERAVSLLQDLCGAIDLMITKPNSPVTCIKDALAAWRDARRERSGNGPADQTTVATSHSSI